MAGSQHHRPTATDQLGRAIGADRQRISRIHGPSLLRHTLGAKLYRFQQQGAQLID
jgi:hypothetical protein